MFNDKLGLTQAVLNGSKTQTRRIMKGKPLFPSDEIESAGVLGDEVQIIANGGESLITMKQPFRVGEVVAVAQSYRDCGYKCFHYRDTDEFMYFVKDNKEISICPAGVRNKMFVVPSLMPHQIHITNVRVERLQDISDEDCLKEGIIKGRCGSEDTHFMDAYYVPNDKQPYCTPQEAFAHLIDKVSKKDVWSENPYVFVYDFELFK